ncbi:hypothetical protein GW17_00038740 [Ensete ventricosum]|nr:hypothetical protein GW17_00038740 [Ensete ventricosum]
MRTARYQAVPSKIDRQRSIEGEIDHHGRLTEQSTVGGRLRKKKGRRKRKRRKKKRRRKNTAPSSPARRRRPRPRALFLPRKETERLPVRGERSRRRHRIAQSFHSKIFDLSQKSVHQSVMLWSQERKTRIHTHPSEGVGITAGGEEVGNVILEEPQHGLLLLPDRLDPRLNALHRAPAAHTQERGEEGNRWCKEWHDRLQQRDSSEQRSRLLTLTFPTSFLQQSNKLEAEKPSGAHQ